MLGTTSVDKVKISVQNNKKTIYGTMMLRKYASENCNR